MLPLVLMAAILLATLIVFWKFLDVVVLAISLAVVLYPLQVYTSKSVNRYISAALITALILVIVVATVLLCIDIMSNNSETIKEVIGIIEIWVQNPKTDPRLFGLPIQREQAATWLSQAQNIFVRFWSTLVSDFPTIVLKTIIFFSSLYVILLRGERIKERIMARVPDTLQRHVQKMSNVTVDTLYAIYVVHLGMAILTFIIAIPFFWFLGYGHVLFFSFLCAFCELIPVLGSSIMFIFLGTYALAIGDINGILILFFIGYLGVSAAPEIFVRPVFMGCRVKLHPLIMIVGFFGGIITMGTAGFVLGPVIIVLLFTGYRILIEDKKASERQEQLQQPS